MDIQYLLTINFMVVSALAIVSVLMQLPWRENVLWIAVNALVILVGAVGLQVRPDIAGTLAALVFVPLVLGPLLFTSLARRAQARGKPALSALYARLSAILHPAERTRFQAALVAAQAHADPAAQTAALRRLAARSSPRQRFQVEALLLRAAADWPGLLAHLRKAPPGTAPADALVIRALGELGRTDEMVRFFETARDRLLSSAEILEAQLVVLAFSGRTNGVLALLERAQGHLDPDVSAYWIAVAERAAGAPPAAWQPLLRRIADTARLPVLRERAERMIQTPPERPELTQAAAAILDRIEARQAVRHPLGDENVRSGTPVTWTLLAAIIAVYVLEEMQGGSQSLRALVALGALWPPYVVERDEWWRLLTAFFLHYGPLHVGANSLMLWALGRPCEQAYGSLKMMLIYVAGGLASTSFVLGLYLYADADPSVLVGASGAVMAVFGGLVGHRLVTWLRHRDVLDKRFLTMVPFIIALQVAADLSMPQVSLAAHASGFIAGLLLGTMLVGGRKRRT